MGLFSIIKKNSRLALRGNWGRAIIILIIMTGVSMLVSMLTQTAVGMFLPTDTLHEIERAESYSDIMSIAEGYQVGAAVWIIYAVSMLLSVLLIAPLTLGMLRWYYSLVHGEGLPLTELFYYFERGRLYARAVCYEINIAVRSLLWMFVFFIVPSAILGIALFFLSGNEELTRAGIMTATLGIFLSVALFFLASLFYAACICRYTLTPYLMAENSELTVRQAIKLSIKYTKGFRFSLVWFMLSYIGWFMLLVFFFPILFVMPYYSTGIAMYSRYIIEKNRSAPAEAEFTQEFSAEMPTVVISEPQEPEDLPEIQVQDEENKETE